MRSANETLRTMLCVQYTARALALGCLAYTRDKLAERGLFAKPERWDEVVEAGGGSLDPEALLLHREALADIPLQIDLELALSREALAGTTVAVASAPAATTTGERQAS